MRLARYRCLGESRIMMSTGPQFSAETHQDFCLFREISKISGQPMLRSTGAPLFALCAPVPTMPWQARQCLDMLIIAAWCPGGNRRDPFPNGVSTSRPGR